MTNETQPAQNIPTPPVPPVFPRGGGLTPGKGMGLIKIVLGAIFIVAAGAGASLAARVWDPLWNPFRPAPEMVLAEMVKKMETVKTVHDKVDFTIGVESKKSAAYFKGTVTGDNDSADPNNIKSANNVNLVFGAEGMQISFEGEGRQLGETSYFKLNTMPVLPMIQPYFQMMGIDLNQLKNQWIKIDKDGLKDLYGGSLTPEMERQMEEETAKQKEIQARIMNLVKGKNLYSVKQEFPDEEFPGIDVGGKKVYHYEISLNKEEFKKIIPGIYGEIENYQGIPAGVASARGKEMMFKKINESLDNMGDLTAQVWIGKKDYYPYRVTFEKEIDMKQFNKTAEGTVNIKLEAELSNFDQPVKIEPPSTFKTIKEIFGGVVERAQENSRAAARNAVRSADMKIIVSAQQQFYYRDNKYVQSKTMPKVIGSFVVPKDPLTGAPYGWIDNTRDSKKFCAYAGLEGTGYSPSSSTAYYTASQRGYGMANKIPTDLDCGSKTVTNEELDSFLKASVSDIFLKVFQR